MKIPKSHEEREYFYADLVRKCFASRADRVARYNILRNWYMFGNGDQQRPCEYNKLFSHIDLLASFLFSGETTMFIVEIPETDDINYEFELKKAKVLAPRVNDTWHDSNTDIIFNDALIWALVYETAFVKLVPMKNGEMQSFVVDPSVMGVLREDVPGLDQQEAFCHEFFLPETQLRRRIEGLGDEEQKKILETVKPIPPGQKANILPTGAQTLIINATQPEIKGEVNTIQLLKYDFNAMTQEDGVMAQELWVYDDELKDYRTVTMLEGDILLHDAGKNSFFPNEHPFIKITPNTMYDYFWGRSEMMFLIPLQEWLNVRIPEIREVLAKQSKPPTSGFAVMESKMAALMQAGGIAAFDQPSAVGKVEQHYPKVAEDLFREFNMIEQMFNEVSGIREIMKGGGESGVRAMGHADMLARLGSSRAKKKAFILEDAVEKCATLMLKIMKLNDVTYYKTDDEDGPGMSFIAKHLTDHAIVKVDAHSSSPIFIEQQRENAKMLFEAGAIDREDLVLALRYHNAGIIIKKLKKREKMEQAAALAEKQQEAAESKGKK